MIDDPSEPDDYLAREFDRPLGGVVVRSNLTRFPFSNALNDGASHLLDKALRALENGDDARAGALVSRAAGLPYDDDEEAYPGIRAIVYLVFGLLVDELEGSDEDDEQWLDAALRVLETCPPDGAAILRLTLDVIRRDYVITQRETTRIVAAVGPDVPDDDAVAAAIGDDSAAMARAILDTLRTVVSYREALRVRRARTT